MPHFPIFLDLTDKPVIVAGNGAFALAKLRLLARTPARITLFAARPEADLAAWLAQSAVTHHARDLEVADLAGAVLVFAAHGRPEADDRLRTLARRAGVLLNVVDNLEGSDFITPAIVECAPVAVAIGTEGEQRVVQRMSEMFVNEARPEREIAETLNAEGHRTDLDRPWIRATVHQVLTNEKYVGNNVFAKVSFKRKQRRVVNPREMWIRAEGAYPAIVDQALFLRAREIVDGRSRDFSDGELLDALRAILQRQGMLSGLVIDEEDDLPSSSAYRNRFGSLLRTYRLIGYEPDRDYSYIEINRALRRAHPQVVAKIIAGVARHGGLAVQDPDTDLDRANDEFTVSIVLVRCTATASGSLRWRTRLDTGLVPDIPIAVRMDEVNEAPRDYYLLPSNLELDRDARQQRQHCAGGDHANGGLHGGAAHQPDAVHQ